MEMRASVPNRWGNARRKLRILYSRLCGNQRCSACGFRGRFITNNVLWPELVAQWELSPDWERWFNLREGQICPQCRCNLRSIQLAAAILGAVETLTGITSDSLSNVFENQKVRALNIGEINSAGTLHHFLAKCPNLRYSEFGSRIPGIPSEDLMNLSYADSSFDLVVTSETLEHVPDVDRALNEIRRVLKPGGIHAFTVPVVWDRTKTRQRAFLEGGKLVHALPPSYHGGAGEEKSDYLVFYEFGADFVKRAQEVGFEVNTVHESENPALVVFITRKLR
jgi:SAM-dependent methyltransferase